MTDFVKTYGVTHVHLFVQDAERAATFYREVFGCVEVLREEFATERLIFVNTPGSKDLITLHERNGQPASASGTHFGFRLVMPDVDAAAEKVLASGGSIRNRGQHAPAQPFLNATDPDGNDFQLWYEE
ncbi:MAG: VOC family protein [Acidimicrobiia bacterium]